MAMNILMKPLAAISLAAGLLAAPAFAQESLGEGSAVVSGAGSSFGYPILSRWAQGYQLFMSGGIAIAQAGGGLDDAVRPALTYEPVGSLAGIMRVQNRAVDFGASDMPLPADELNRLNLAQFPLVIGGVVAVTNIDGVGPGALKLTGPLLADIFLGKVKNWSDPAIKALNGELKLPDAAINVVHRADGSGTTYNFTDYLSKASADWKGKVGSDLLVAWPTGAGAKGSGGMVSAVRGAKNSIGYVEFTQAQQGKLSHALIANRSGRYVAPEARSFQAAAATAEWNPANGFGLMLTDAPGEHAYPVVATVFALVPKNAPPRKMRATMQFFQWSLEQGAQDAAALGYVPLPLELVEQIKTYWKPSFPGIAGL
jgi:phosphate transport system substrate-binding protein